MNIRSLLGKSDELEEKLSRVHAMMAAVTESWLKKQVTDSKISFSCYQTGKLEQAAKMHYM